MERCDSSRSIVYTYILPFYLALYYIYIITSILFDCISFFVLNESYYYNELQRKLPRLKRRCCAEPTERSHLRVLYDLEILYHDCMLLCNVLGSPLRLYYSSATLSLN